MGDAVGLSVGLLVDALGFGDGCLVGIGVGALLGESAEGNIQRFVEHVIQILVMVMVVGRYPLLYIGSH